jgi:hypothetical protein
LSNCPVEQEYEHQDRNGHAEWRFPQRGKHAAGGDRQHHENSCEVPGKTPQTFSHQARGTVQVVEIVKV